jgi:hypothetical protein
MTIDDLAKIIALLKDETNGDYDVVYGGGVPIESWQIVLLPSGRYALQLR